MTDSSDLKDCTKAVFLWDNGVVDFEKLEAAAEKEFSAIPQIKVVAVRAAKHAQKIATYRLSVWFKPALDPAQQEAILRQAFDRLMISPSDLSVIIMTPEERVAKMNAALDTIGISEDKLNASSDSV